MPAQYVSVLHFTRYFVEFVIAWEKQIVVVVWFLLSFFGRLPIGEVMGLKYFKLNQLELHHQGQLIPFISIKNRNLGKPFKLNCVIWINVGGRINLPIQTHHLMKGQITLKSLTSLKETSMASSRCGRRMERKSHGSACKCFAD